MYSMNDMLGRTFQVRNVLPGIVELPSPDADDSHNSVKFPNSVIRSTQEIVRKGDVVKMLSSEDAVRISFNSCGYRWDTLMKGMLGQEYPILEETRKGIIALPSPDGSQNGKCY